MPEYHSTPIDLSAFAAPGTVHACPGGDCPACAAGSRPDSARGASPARSEPASIGGGRVWFWWTTRPGSQDNPRTPVATGNTAARWTPDRSRNLHAFRRNLASSAPTDPPEWLAGIRGAMGRAFARRLADHARGCRFQPRRGTV